MHEYATQKQLDALGLDDVVYLVIAEGECPVACLNRSEAQRIIDARKAWHTARRMPAPFPEHTVVPTDQAGVSAALADYRRQRE